MLKSHRSKMSVIYMHSWKQCAFLVITTMALWHTSCAKVHELPQSHCGCMHIYIYNHLKKASSKLSIKTPWPFLIWFFRLFSEKYGYLCVLHDPVWTKFLTLIELANTNKCSGLKSIMKCYFAGYSSFSNFYRGLQKK